MTVALSVAVGRGRRGGGVRLHRQHLCLDGGLRGPGAGSSRSCWCPQGKIAAGKLAQAIVHGAQVIMVRGNFDDCLRISRDARRALPGRAGELGEPDAAGGAEDRLLRDRRLPRRRPRRARAADRQRRQHLGVLAGLPRVPTTPARPPELPGDAGLAGRGRRAAGARARRCPTPRRSPRRSGSATRPPGTWRWRPREESGGRFRKVTDEEILAAQRELACRDGVFVEPASAAGVAGLLLEARGGRRTDRAASGGHRDRTRAEGHRHRAVRFTDLVDTVCRRRRRRGGRGRRAG